MAVRKEKNIKYKKPGHPTKYNVGVLKKVEEFTLKREIEGMIPTTQGLSAYLNVNPDTIFEWANVHREFSESLKKMLAIQADMMQTKGLSHKYNPVMSIFLLKNNHGFKDKTEVDNTTAGQPLPQPIINVNVHPDGGEHPKHNP